MTIKQRNQSNQKNRGQATGDRQQATLSVENTHRRSSVRVGNRVPVGEGALPNYQDVGINIDCGVMEFGNEVAISTNFESTNVLGPEGSAASTRPIIRQVRFSGDSRVQLGKPSIVAVLDDVSSPRRYEIEVTATKEK